MNSIYVSGGDDSLRAALEQTQTAQTDDAFACRDTILSQCLVSDNILDFEKFLDLKKQITVRELTVTFFTFLDGLRTWCS